MTMTLQFSDMTSTSIFFDTALFLLSNLVTGPSFMSISSLVLELWQISFIRDWPEIRKSEIASYEFCPIYGDWGKLWIPNLSRMSLIECYWMLQNSKVTAFNVFELLRENQLGGKIKNIGSSSNHTSFTTQRYIQNIVEHLKRSFLRKLLTSFSLELFSQKATSDMIDWVLDMPFKLCIILLTETQLPNFFSSIF